MPLLIDLHVHTNRYSQCSRIDPLHLIPQAVRAGLDGLVITEHKHQWSQAELDDLLKQSDAPGFLILSAFEYSSSQGDILVYGLEPSHAQEFSPGMPPEEAARMAHDLGAVCIAAHPTRLGMGFDERILRIPFAAIEVCSVNLREHERRLAMHSAENGPIPPVAASDAHVLSDVGCYVTEFLDPIRSMAGLQDALKNGRFQPRDTNSQTKERRRWT